MRIREASRADAPAIAALHARSWRAAYRGMLSDAYLDGDVGEERAAWWGEALSNPKPGQAVFVAEEGSAIAGFALAYGADDPAWGTRVEAIHVDRASGRRGIGAALMAHVARWSADRHPGLGLWLWVLEPNESARRFYARLGGLPVEASTWDGLDGGKVPKWRIAWRDAAVLRDNAQRASERAPSR